LLDAVDQLLSEASTMTKQATLALFTATKTTLTLATFFESSLLWIILGSPLSTTACLRQSCVPSSLLAVLCIVDEVPPLRKALFSTSYGRM
jgi:hypothetical protein